MTTYTVRVELHEAGQHQYNQLHDAMAKAQFSRTFVKDGREVSLPRAEYRSTFEATVSAQDVADRLEPIARAINPGGASVIVTSGDGFAGAGGFHPPELVYHLRPEQTGGTSFGKCGAAALNEDLRPSEGDARDQMSVRGGRLCTLCFR